jgi:hypothetical protein
MATLLTPILDKPKVGIRELYNEMYSVVTTIVNSELNKAEADQDKKLILACVKTCDALVSNSLNARREALRLINDQRRHLEQGAKSEDDANEVLPAKYEPSPRVNSALEGIEHAAEDEPFVPAHDEAAA